VDAAIGGREARATADGYDTLIDGEWTAIPPQNGHSLIANNVRYSARRLLLVALSLRDVGRDERDADKGSG
jgi:hypothetical protein